MNHLLEVKNLKTEFHVDGSEVKAVDGVSYYINEGEIISFVGESGSGKSITQMSGLQLIPSPPGKIIGGEVLYKGQNLLQFKRNSEELRSVRGGEIGFIFQEPMTSLNPVLSIREQMVESIIQHLKLNKEKARDHAIEIIKQVGIPDAEKRIDDYPHQFSGGMRQRLMIAMVLACDPKIIIADEATTALDVTTQAQILELLKDIVKKQNISLIIVTHNLGIVARYAERIYVMYAGNIVETGTAKDIFENPSHPYTLGLINAVPKLDDPKDKKLIPIDGLPPNLAQKPEQCAFLERCCFAKETCHLEAAPSLSERETGHYSACYVDISGQRSERSGVSRTENKQKHFLEDDIILSVDNLKIHFPVRKGLLNKKIAEVKAVDGVSFSLNKGETLGLVGESGCGKTTVARAIIRLLDPTEGQIMFEDKDIARLPKRKLDFFRRKVSMIFQDPFSSLNPRQTAEKIVGEPLIIHRLVKDKSSYHRRIDELFRMVGLDPRLKDRVPHEFSGGQRQRIGIARALASDPSLIICDEAISALDVSIQAQIINLLEHLKEEFGLSYLFIAHDLSVVRHISDRVAVMYLGRIIEMGDWESLYLHPQHPYTKALLDAVPNPDPRIEKERSQMILKGDVPSPLQRPKGCGFHTRCPLATEECKHADPELHAYNKGHSVACIKI